MEFSFYDKFYWVPLSHSQRGPLGAVPGPKKQFYDEFK